MSPSTNSCRQNSTTLRRLTTDHASLRTAGLPPNYLFPPSSPLSSDDAADDMTQLVVLLTGPHGTPYASGLWKLQLKIPVDYPRSPPKAAFRTRIWHPNVEEKTGGVCVDTLKRDWEEKLTLRDVLVTISCLLINPNPDSALNAAAGQLLQEDYEAFARQARLMSSIHAPVPRDLRDKVEEAKRRGEDPEMLGRAERIGEEKWMGVGKGSSVGGTATSGVVMKRKPQPSPVKTGSVPSGLGATSSSSSSPSSRPGTLTFAPPLTTHFPSRPLSSSDSDSDSETEASASKENNPSPTSPLPSPRKITTTTIGVKRPLSTLPAPDAGDDCYYIVDDDDVEDVASGHMSASERNIANNVNVDTTGRRQATVGEDDEGPQRKSPRLTERLRGVNAGPGDSNNNNAVSSGGGFVTPYEDNSPVPPTAVTPPKPASQTTTPAATEGKENHLSNSPAGVLSRGPSVVRKPGTTPATTTGIAAGAGAGSGLPVRSGSGSGGGKKAVGGIGVGGGKGGKGSAGAKGGRVGLRRL